MTDLLTSSQKSRKPRRLLPFPAFPPRQRITRAMCETLEINGLLTERYELIDGVIYIKTPKNPPHRIANWRLKQWLDRIFGEAFVQKEDPVLLPGEEGNYTEPEPDLAVTRQPATDYMEHNPGPEEVVLVVEVSDTTLQYDLKTKAGFYARAGVPEYWVFDIAGRQIHRHRVPTANGYREIVILNENQTIAAPGREETIAISALLAPQESAQNPITGEQEAEIY